MFFAVLEDVSIFQRVELDLLGRVEPESLVFEEETVVVGLWELEFRSQESECVIDELR